MKCKMNIVFIFLMLLLGFVGVTYAYFTESESFENDFVVADFGVVIEENFEQGFLIYESSTYIPKEVFVVNKKNTSAIIRVSYNQNAMDYTSDLEGTIFGTYLLNNEIIDMIFDYDWTEEFDNYFIYQDGWFYYLKVLPANTSIQIMSGITLNDFSTKVEHYNLDFNIEAVQATPEAVEEVWGWQVSIDESGNIIYNFPDS